MSLINIKNLTFSYVGAADNIFENASLQIDTDWKLGLVGRNGKGKTTLLNLLLNKYEYGGKIESSVSFEYFPYEADSGKTVMQAAYELLPNLQEWQYKKELGLLQVQPQVLDQEFKTLSKGEQTKVKLALMFLRQNAYLLIDEPTNHLDLEGRQLLAQYLNKKNGYILVSHDRAFLDNCVDHILSINRNNIEIQSGNFSGYLVNKDRQDNYEQDENDRLKTQINRLKTASKRVGEFADKAEKEKLGGKKDSGLRPDRGFLGAKAAKVMKGAKVLENRLNKSVAEKSALLKNVERQDLLKLKGGNGKVSRLVKAQNFGVEFNGRVILQNLSFEINRGDRVAITGKNGSGKTTVLKAVIGELNEYSGQMQVFGKINISYISQDTSMLKGSLDAFCEQSGAEKTELLTMLAKLGFNKTQFDKRIEEFSEGQKKKLLIAKSLCAKADLYVWDEPLNYVDIICRKQIEEMILQSDATMLFVEHDKYFCELVANHIIKL